MSAARVLFVDDDANLLLSIQRMLRSSGLEVTVSTSAVEALQWLKAGRTWDAIISDMRMPEMDGAAFLQQAKALLPDATRVMLTGEADLVAASRAVNEGAIWRLLIKPASRETLQSTIGEALEHRRLLRAERELLEKTLTGAVSALCEVMSLLQPGLFGRSQRLRRIASLLARQVGLFDAWRVEIAAQLSQFALVTLPPELAARVGSDEPLEAGEAEEVQKALAQGRRIVSMIPRLEPVADLLKAADGEAPKSLEAAVLFVARSIEKTLFHGRSLDDALKAVPANDASVRHALAAAGQLGHLLLETRKQRAVAVAALGVGMVLVDDVKTKSGALLIARGHLVSDLVLSRLRTFASTVGVQEPLVVTVNDDVGY
ncbi:MAG: response regulator [Archangium sp.]|nr:response regulator [Archangium sp.]